MRSHLPSSGPGEHVGVVDRKRSTLARVRVYAAIARPDHWVKNLFVLPGILLPFTVVSIPLHNALASRILLGLIAVCLISSSNYVINEILDAPFDRLHPIKKNRPIPSGQIKLVPAYCEWILLMLLGLGFGILVSLKFTAVLSGLWIMGCIYNIRPVRTKDLVYLDVLTEAVNSPLRMLAGWYMVTNHLLPTLSLLMSYWMVGCYFMALKRFSEYRELANPQLAAAYRPSFHHYTERSLLVSIMFYASTSMLFLGAFIVRYRIELVLAFPFLALVMAVYLRLSFDVHSALQNPEKLYRQKTLMFSVVLCSITMATLLFVNLPFLHVWFPPLYETK